MTLQLRKPGLFTSLQGLGQFGMQQFGINPRGAMDRTAARIANILVGNADNASVLEIHFPGPEIEFGSTVRMALGGADFSAHLDGRPIDRWQPLVAKEGATLSFSNRLSGSRCYLAVEGGLNPSSPTENGGVAATVADYFTTPLLRGSCFTTGPEKAECELPFRSFVSPDCLPRYSSDPIIRVTCGAEYGLLDAPSADDFETGQFMISPDSNRMGFRLTGPQLKLRDRIEMLSASVTFGTVQLLPSGQLVILMADHQTTGGYPRIANVVSTDLPLVAQLGAGNELRFKMIDLAEAERRAAQLELDLRMLRIGVMLTRRV